MGKNIPISAAYTILHVLYLFKKYTSGIMQEITLQYTLFSNQFLKP